MADRVGQRLGNYRLVRLLGQGGFAEVYLGEHVHLGTQAAIKLLHTQLASEDTDAFRKEARTIARLIHPHIVRVFDFGIEGETPFLAMDYAPNGSVRKRHPKGFALPLPTILNYVKQVADALQYAHNEYFIHRDVKPENLLIGRGQEILLSDFGVALVAQSSRSQSMQNVAGTASYMAPEQFQGRPRPASDQYALAVMVYEWLTGACPFSGSFTEIASQHLFVPPPPLQGRTSSIPLAVEQVVMTALAKDPHQRFSSVQAFSTAFEQASRSLPPINAMTELRPSQQLPGPVPASGETFIPTELITPANQSSSPGERASSLAQSSFPSYQPIPTSQTSLPARSVTPPSQSSLSTGVAFPPKPPTLAPGTMLPVKPPKPKQSISRGWLILLVGVALLIVVGGLLITMSNQGAANNTHGSGNAITGMAVLKIAAQSYDFAQAGFNPYNGHPNAGIGLVYETLYFVNINGGSFTPMLATSYSWNSDNTQVTFALRQNVKWNDGQPFTANDVAFTFNLMKQYPAADSLGVWSFLSSVTAPDANTVVMTFQKAYPPVLVTIAGHVYIVPQHVFGSVGDPTKYLTDKPVGTGPFTLTRYQADLAVYDKNPSYWQTAKVKVNEIRFPEYKDNATLQLALPQGDIDWAGYFSPTLQQDFVAKDPAHNRIWMDAINLYSICVNQKDPVVGGQAGLPVRLALSTALDRNAIAQQATAGLEPPGSMTGLVLPTANSWLAPQFANLPTTADTAKAEKYLTDAGFTKGSDGIYQKNGRRLSLTLRSVDSYSDWNAAAKTIADEARAVGIEIKNVTVGEDNYYTLRTDGKFDYQLMFCGMVGGPTPFYLYNQYLNSAQIGQGKFNFVAWNDPATDQLLNQYASTTDPAVQKQAIQGIETIFVNNQPFIPLWTGADYDEYSTRNFTGWPDQSNPYSSGSPNTAPDYEQVILHLQPVS